MAHRHVMDKDGNAKYVHSSHGDVPHSEANEGHSAVKQCHIERQMPHGHAAHPNDLKKDSDGDYDE